jgi:hypothetical protein
VRSDLEIFDQMEPCFWYGITGGSVGNAAG